MTLTDQLIRALITYRARNGYSKTIHPTSEHPELLETCKHCGDPMYTTVRAHHHTELNQDVTK